MKLVSAATMREIDAETIKGRGILGEQLMENAGAGIAEIILDDILSNPAESEAVIFCGTGNNGGDGYVIARHLAENGVAAQIYFLGPIEKFSADTRTNYDCAIETDGITLTEIIAIEQLPEDLECDLIVDAIFGTGFSGAPRGITAELIEYINQFDIDTVAVDVPSGLDADTGQHEGAVIQAHYTFTLGLPKFGLFVSPGRELSGAVETVPIGIPDDVIDRFDITTELIEPEEIADLFPYRKPDGHKGDFGKLFVLAGSTGLTGAAAMTAQAAYRTGCGMVKLGCPRSVQPILAGILIETMCHPLPDVAKKGTLATRGLGEVRLFAESADALVIGPGLGLHHETGELVRRLLLDLDKPVLIDADGLTHLAKDVPLLKKTKASVCLSPHHVEFERLTGEPTATDYPERMEQARRFAVEYNLVLILKGSPTLVASPEGVVWFNQSGNSGMATGGSGDVLSGMIGSFLAQGMDTLEAALCGVFMHGFAGDLAAEAMTERCVVASDLIRFLPHAFGMMETLGE